MILPSLHSAFLVLLEMRLWFISFHVFLLLLHVAAWHHHVKLFDKVLSGVLSAQKMAVSESPEGDNNQSIPR